MRAHHKISTRNNSYALAKALTKKISNYKSTKMNNLFPSLPPLSVYVPTEGSGREEVKYVRQDNDDDTFFFCPAFDL
jgi:hypothetical protein